MFRTTRLAVPRRPAAWRRLGRWLPVAIVLVTASGLAEAQRPVRRDLLVAAAASLSGIAPRLTQSFHDASGIDLRFNFAGSNTLARQILEGAHVDVFISADEAQMSLVEQAGHVVGGTRTDIVSNELVLIANAPPRAKALRPDDLASAAIRRVAMGDPAAVPAGVYGQRWLENLRLWSVVQPKVVPLPSSPAVVAAIREGRADVGIVYLSDATNHADTSVRVAYRAGFDDAPRIVYPAAAIRGGRVPLAQEFIAFLRGAAAQEIFASAGFRPLAAR
jgi:molybdate transport system substrate-binding protein